MSEDIEGRRRWSRYALMPAVGLVIAVLSLGAWQVVESRRVDLSETDPDGARACQILADWLRDPGAAPGSEVSRRVASHALMAVTDAIRAAANGIADVPRPGHPGEFDGFPIVDLRGLHAACGDAGFDLPPYPLNAP
jgi:hypothetical protein